MNRMDIMGVLRLVSAQLFNGLGRLRLAQRMPPPLGRLELADGREHSRERRGLKKFCQNFFRQLALL